MLQHSLQQLSVNHWQDVNFNIFHWLSKDSGQQAKTQLMNHLMYHHLVMGVACAIAPSDTTSATDVSFQNLVFWNLFEFSVAEII